MWKSHTILPFNEAVFYQKTIVPSRPTHPSKPSFPTVSFASANSVSKAVYLSHLPILLRIARGGNAFHDCIHLLIGKRTLERLEDHAISIGNAIFTQFLKFVEL